MALQETITDERGAKTTYHRIARAVLDFDEKKAIVLVRSYASEKVRETEKGNSATKAKYHTLMAELDALVAEPTNDNKKRRIELTNEVNALPAISNVEDYHLAESTHAVEIDPNKFTLKDIYAELKNTAYANAKNIV
jgi:hypothetical protein